MAIGCTDKYSALIVRQAGTATGQGDTPVAVGSIQEITSLTYGRLLSGTSTAQISFTRCPTNCSFMIGTPVKPWAYELWVYRDNLLAWCGPIVVQKQSRASETFEITAWDITGWNARRKIDSFYSNTDNPTSIAVDLVSTFFDGSFTRSDPAYAGFMTVMGLAPATISVEYDAEQYQVSAKWSEMVTAGFNYTTLTRYVLMMGQEAPNVNNPYVIDASNILADMELVEDGTDFATRVTSLGEGLTSVQGPFGDEAAYYGVVDWPAVKYQGLTDQTELDDLVGGLFNSKRDLSPELVIPAGSSLAPQTEIEPSGIEVTTATPVALPDLICGMRYDVQVPADQFCEAGRYPMRLNEVKVTWTPDSQERIAVSFGTLGVPDEE